jgi:50S ribosomal protein L16 3-hydroxylase
MVSFAPRAGGVGPHLDSYDVFLLQGQGRRRWRIDSKAPKDLRLGLDLRILKEFHAEEDWILEPGDMLYLPPGLAHYGAAMEECLTYSIGFRAPSSMDLLAAAQQKLISADAVHGRYQDPGMRRTRVPGEIPRAAVSKMRAMLQDALHQLKEADFDALVGELLTEPKGSAALDEKSISTTLIRSRLKQGWRMVRSPGSRLGFLRRGKASDLFANGQKFPLSPKLSFAAPLLTNERRLCADVLAPHLKKEDFIQLLARLTSAGAFRLER